MSLIPLAAWLVLALFVLWGAWVSACGLLARRWPERYPLIDSPDRPGFRLRLPWFRRAERELERLGFRRIGLQRERTLGFSITSAIYFSAERGTYATLFSLLLQPAVTFLTEGADGTIVHTGISGRLPARYGELHDQGVGGSIASRLEAHEELLAKAGVQIGEVAIGPRPPAGAPGTLAHRGALTRRFSVARFGRAADGPLG